MSVSSMATVQRPCIDSTEIPPLPAEPLEFIPTDEFNSTERSLKQLGQHFSKKVGLIVCSSSSRIHIFSFSVDSKSDPGHSDGP